MTATPDTGARSDAEVDANYRIDVSRLDAAVLYRITAMAFRHRWRMALAIAATIAAASFQLMVPQFLGRAVDQAHGVLAEAAAGVVKRKLPMAVRSQESSPLVGLVISRTRESSLRCSAGDINSVEYNHDYACW